MLEENFELLKEQVEKDTEQALTVLHYSFDIAVVEEDVEKAIDTMTDAENKCEDMLIKAKVRYSGLKRFTSYSNKAARLAARATNIDLTLEDFKTDRKDFLEKDN